MGESPVNTYRGIVGLWAVSCVMAHVPVGARAADEPLRLLFWQPQDIVDAQNVCCAALPIVKEGKAVLLRPDATQETLWYMPTAAVPVGPDVRIYYQRVEKGQAKYEDQRTLCLGILRGREFLVPELGLHPQSWDGPHNVVLQRSPHKPTWGGFNVFQIVGSEQAGYRLLYWDQPPAGEAGAMLAASPDGLHWTKDDRGAVLTEHNDAFTLVHTGEGGEYLLYQTALVPWPDKPLKDNLDQWRRVISLRRSRDLVSWTDQEIVLQPDEQDAPTAEFYLLKVFRYADRYVGLLMKYFADPQAPGRHSAILRTELVLSNDGLDWQRPYRGTDMGVWTYADPFAYEGGLGLVAHDERCLTLFPVRRDGFACCAADAQGSFCTRPFIMPPGELRLNADCRQGSVAVELLDENGVGIPGCEAAGCRLEAADGCDLPLRWRDSATDHFAGQRVRLRFVLERAKVWSVTGTH
jgi:hypothetical protein